MGQVIELRGAQSGRISSASPAVSNVPQGASNPEEQNFYVTYGCGSNLNRKFSVVRAIDYATARSEVERVTGRNFAFMYDEADFAGQAEQWDMTEVPLQPQVMLEG